MATVQRTAAEICREAKRAARKLASIDGATCDAALEAMASAIEGRVPEIIEANERDLENARAAGIGDALIDRLRLDEARIQAMADGVREVAALPDPVGELIEEFVRPNGLRVRKVRVPLGVVAVVYESRPNVTIDCAALALKSGNAIVLRGSSTAAESNAVLAAIASEAVVAAGLPEGAISLVAGGGREELAEIATQRGVVDLVIPRGGEGLKAALEAVATVPVIYAASGNCHVYVHADADIEMAKRITINAKVQRPGVCNAAETLLVHRDIAGEILPALAAELQEAGVELRADARARAASAAAGDGMLEVTEEDWATEYHALVLAVGVVDSLDEAIEHVNLHSSGHSDAIVTGDAQAGRRFQVEVDSACVYVNASTRFTDGGEFGMGAEIGNSTQKLHARGPIGVRELTSYKYLAEGDGLIRA
jgi:glutamate-5-semialdehyde dehydrogenase